MEWSSPVGIWYIVASQAIGDSRQSTVSLGVRFSGLIETPYFSRDTSKSRVTSDFNIHSARHMCAHPGWEHRKGAGLM